MRQKIKEFRNITLYRQSSSCNVALKHCVSKKQKQNTFFQILANIDYIFQNYFAGDSVKTVQ